MRSRITKSELFKVEKFMKLLLKQLLLLRFKAEILQIHNSLIRSGRICMITVAFLITSCANSQESNPKSTILGDWKLVKYPAIGGLYQSRQNYHVRLYFKNKKIEWDGFDYFRECTSQSDLEDPKHPVAFFCQVFGESRTPPIVIAPDGNRAKIHQFEKFFDFEQWTRDGRFIWYDIGKFIWDGIQESKIKRQRDFIFDTKTFLTSPTFRVARKYPQKPSTLDFKLVDYSPDRTEAVWLEMFNGDKHGDNHFVLQVSLASNGKIIQTIDSYVSQHKWLWKEMPDVRKNFKWIQDETKLWKIVLD